MATGGQHATSYRQMPAIPKALREPAGLIRHDPGRRLGKPQRYVSDGENANLRIDVSKLIAWAGARDFDAPTAFAALWAGGDDGDSYSFCTRLRSRVEDSVRCSGVVRYALPTCVASIHPAL